MLDAQHILEHPVSMLAYLLGRMVGPTVFYFTMIVVGITLLLIVRYENILTRKLADAFIRLTETWKKRHS